MMTTHELIERLNLHRSWRDSHGELNDAPHKAAQAISTLTAEVEELRAAVRPFPMQSGPPIPWALAQHIYEHGYRFTSQSLERVAERGGFGWSEVAFFYKELARRGPAEQAKLIAYPATFGLPKGGKTEPDCALSEKPKQISDEGAKIIPFDGGGTVHCPVCMKAGPHNHSILDVEAFHRANENSARNYGLVTFSVDEVRDFSARRANGINDRGSSRWHP